eukprot:1689391-Ditylum_brightwellii.AAC.1
MKHDDKYKKRFFFVGFGSVNRALAKMLLDDTKASLFCPFGGFEVVGVATGSHGVAAIKKLNEDSSHSDEQLFSRSLNLDSMLDIANVGGDLSECALLGNISTED